MRAQEKAGRYENYDELDVVDKFLAKTIAEYP